MRSRSLLAALLVLALAAGCGGDGASGGGADAPPPTTGTPAPPATGGTTTASLLPASADALPEFALADYEALLGELRGGPVVVNIWASWCGPCNEEAPTLAAAHATHGDRVQFLGVDILDTRDGAREFIARYSWTYPSVFDPSGAIRDGLGLLGQPVTLFYEADGTLASTYTGAIPEALLEERIQGLLASEA